MVNVKEFEEDLRGYLESTLPNIFQGEPKPMANYIITLLSRDQELDELREACNEKLMEFLHDETGAFVDSMFKFVSDQMKAKRSRAEAERDRDEPDSEEDDRSHKRKRRREDSRERSDRGHGRNRSRDRDRDRYRRDDSRERGRRRESPRHRGGTERKDGRRERCRDFDTKGFCSRGSNCRYEHVSPVPAIGGDTYDPDRPSYDSQRLRGPPPVGPDGRLLPYMPGPPMGHFPRQPMMGGPHPMHMNLPYGVPPPGPPRPGMLDDERNGDVYPMQDRDRRDRDRGRGRDRDMGRGPPSGGQHIPVIGDGPGVGPPLSPTLGRPMGMHPGARGPPRDMRRPMGAVAGPDWDRQGQGRGGKFRRDYGRDGRPLTLRASERNTKLCVINLPREKNNLSDLTEHFKQFGEVTNIRVIPKDSLAFVSFRNHAMARKAYESPEALFNNRHVVVRWAHVKPEQEDREEAEVENGKKLKEAAEEDIQSGKDGRGPTVVVKKRDRTSIVKATPGVGAISKTFNTDGTTAESAAAVSAPVNSDILALRAKLLKKQLEQQKEIISQLESGSLSAEDKQKLKTKLKTLGSQIDSQLKKQKAEAGKPVAIPVSSPAPVAHSRPVALSSAEATKAALDRELDEMSPSTNLKEKLERIEKEAASMGLLDANGDPIPDAAGYRGGRGGRGRGRGRGWARGGRGAMTWTPSSAPTDARGRGGGAWAPASRGRGGGRGGGMSLDLRPKAVHIASLPDDLQDEGALRAHLTEAFGPLTSVDVSNDTAKAVFKTHNAAGKAVKSPGSLVVTWGDSESKPSSNGNDVDAADMEDVEVHQVEEVEEVVHEVPDARNYDSDEDDRDKWKR